jgi:uncharacterized protein
MEHSITINFGSPLPLFPLQRCVLLPHVTVPLQVFEPRYLALLKDALDSRGLIAMATFEGQDWKGDYDGRPPLRTHVCVGRIVQHERVRKNCFLLMLQGICRAEIINELPHTPYRVALLRPTEIKPAMEIDLVDDRRQIEELLGDPLLRQLASVTSVQNCLTPEVPTLVLVDLATLAICDDSEVRYAMLAEPDIHARVHTLRDMLRQTRHTLSVAERMGPGKSDDGWSLN